MREKTEVRTKSSARAGVPNGVPTPSKRTKPSRVVIKMKQGIEIERTIDGVAVPLEEPQQEKVTPKRKRIAKTKKK